MISALEKQRLENEIPFEHTVMWKDEDEEVQQASYELTPYWAGGDVDNPDYPAIVFDWDSQGNPNANAESINRVSQIRADENDEDAEIVRDSPEFDELSITIAAEEGFKDSIPAQVRAEELTREVWQWVRQRATRILNSEGDDGERPMIVNVTSAPTPARVDRTYRVEFSIEIRHTVEDVEPVEAVDEFDSDVTVN